jgi:protein-L-isoaspartate(D-aspartate) O-methyltransferase
MMITAAVPEIPRPLIRQLADDGVLVAPIGYSGVQELVAYKKTAGKISKKAICDVRFVRLIGTYGFEQ